MNAVIRHPSSSSSTKSSTPSLEALSRPAANDAHLLRVAGRAHDPVTRAYMQFAKPLRAAARNYVQSCDVDDLVQDVFVAAAAHPAKLAALDRATLSWLIGIAKRCAPNYVSRVGMLPLDHLLLREAGDDEEGRAMHEQRKKPKGRRARERE